MFHNSFYLFVFYKITISDVNSNCERGGAVWEDFCLNQSVLIVGFIKALRQKATHFLTVFIKLLF